jgi:hypothetical protein
MEQQKQQPKIMQVNIIDVNGKLTINVKKKGFSPAEAIGILELAKCQIRNSMKMQKGFEFKKDDNK